MPMSLWLFLSLALQASTPSAPATFITAAEAEAVLKEQIPKNVVDQPIKLSEVLGGKASVARLHRAKPEASALIHNDVTETYYIVKGSGTIVTGGSLGNPKPTDLTRVNAGMSQTGTRKAASRGGSVPATSSSSPRARRTASASWTGRSATWCSGSSRRDKSTDRSQPHTSEDRSPHRHIKNQRIRQHSRTTYLLIKLYWATATRTLRR